MIFCGYCGLQLPPGVTRCPRCGTAVDADIAIDERQIDDPIIAAPVYMVDDSPYAQQKDVRVAHPATPAPPQPLILPPRDVDMRGYDAGSGANYPTQAVPQVAYNAHQDSNLPQQVGSYPGYAPHGSQYYTAEPRQHSRNARGRATALIIILLGLFLILAAMVWFAIARLDILHNLGVTAIPVVSSTTVPSTADPQQQAQALVSQYYSDVNSKNYREAYDLWGDTEKPTPTYAKFLKGYQYTLHDELTITKTVLLNDGTVQVMMTVHATEQTSSDGAVQNTYQGYYIVGQRNGTWRILSGQLNKI